MKNNVVLSLQIKNLRLKEVKSLIQFNSVGECLGRALNPITSLLELKLLHFHGSRVDIYTLYWAFRRLFYPLEFNSYKISTLVVLKSYFQYTELGDKINTYCLYCMADKSRC